MTIKKYGTEDAQVETRAEDNDAETWRTVAKSATDDARRQRSEQDKDAASED